MDRITAAQVFVAIAECGSMAAAAQVLDMSRAMVTRYLAQMEQWAGARLLHRTTRRLSLTSAGEQALLRCRRLLEVADEVQHAATRESDALHGLHGLLRVACSQSLAEVVLPQMLAGFLRAHPRVGIELYIDGRPVNLVEQRIDLAIRITNDLEPNVVARLLGRCDSVVCATPTYLAAHGTPQTLQDLARHNCLSYAYYGRSLWQFTDAQGHEQGVAVTGNLKANESQVLLAATLRGIGVSLQPAYAVSDALARGELVALVPEWTPLPLGIHAIYATRRHMPPALRALLDALKAHFSDSPHWPPRRGPAEPPAPAAHRTA